MLGPEDVTNIQSSRAPVRTSSSSALALTLGFYQISVLDVGRSLMSPFVPGVAADTPRDLLVVDELGPLEFQRCAGLLEGLAAVDRLHRAVVLHRGAALLARCSPEALARLRGDRRRGLILSVGRVVQSEGTPAAGRARRVRWAGRCSDHRDSIRP